MDDVIYRKDVLELFEDINNMLNQTLEDFTLAYPTTKICEFCRDVINDLTDDVKELPSAETTPWILCRDTLPGTTGAYLVACTNGNVKVGHFTTFDNKWTDARAVAWMPLPEWEGDPT